MKGPEAEQQAHETSTTEYEKRRATIKKWFRRGLFWGTIVIISLWAHSCFIEVTRTAFFGAAKARDAVEQTARKLREPKKDDGGAASKPSPLRPSVPGNWELYREFDIILAGDEESLEYRIKADWGERRVPTWRIHDGAVDVSFNRKAGGTDSSSTFLTPPEKAANGTEFIQFRARKGGASITLWVWRDRTTPVHPK